jgi:hypothetical protein
MKTAIKVALTLLAAAALASLFPGSHFANRKPPVIIIASEIGTGYCAMDSPAAKGDLVTLDSVTPGKCRAERAREFATGKRRSILIGIAWRACRARAPCKILMLSGPATAQHRQKLVLRE